MKHNHLHEASLSGFDAYWNVKLPCIPPQRLVENSIGIPLLAINQLSQATTMKKKNIHMYIYIYNTNLLRNDWNEMASKVPMCKIVIYRCPFVLALCRTGILKVQVPVTKNQAMLSNALCQLPAWTRHAVIRRYSELNSETQISAN